ncbi:MAG: RNA 2',3'-cyclic phosphodiesterase [Bacillota bacterium]
MRLFVAINFSERNRNLIKNKVKLIKNNVEENVKWVKKENWHITVKFLGEVKEKKVSNIKNKINEISKINKFYFQINKIGAFPSLNYPKVVYLGINRGKDKLKEVNEKVETKLSELNFEKEDRPFTPHVTIGRSKDYTDNNNLANTLIDIAQKKNFINIYSKMDKISLMKSELTDKGPLYEEIFSKNIK